MISRSSNVRRRSGSLKRSNLSRRPGSDGKRGAGSGSVFVRKFLIASMVTALFLAGLAGAGYGIRQWAQCCSIFQISSIDLHQAGEKGKRIDPKEIVRLSGIRSGQNIFSVNAEKVRAAIMAGNPWIASVELERDYPNRIIIKVREREPAALVSIQGKIWLMDKEGKVFKEAAPEDGFKGPIITGLLKDDKGPHGKGEQDGQALDMTRVRDAMTIVKLSRKGARALGYFNISQIDFPDEDTLVVYTADKAVPFYLERSELKGQFYRAEKILYQLYTSGEYAKVASVTVGYGDDMALAKLKN